jgi:hypothetical protein
MVVASTITYSCMQSVEQELPIRPVISGVRVIRSLCVCFVDRCLSICPFPFVYYVACPSIYAF